MKTALVAVLGFVVVGCSNGPAAKLSPTYAQDVQPLLANHCNSCHQAGGIAPIPLTSFADALQARAEIAAMVSTKQMPPWAPSESCNSFQGDRSLTQDEIDTIVSWATGDSAEGDTTVTPTPIYNPSGLSRVDFSLAMPEPYTPQISPDDYHCFMLDWPETTEKYVTGFSLTPGNTKIVHHAIAYIAQPSDLASYEAQEQTLPDGGVIPSYTCFGGPGGMGALTGWLGAWVPGTSYGDFPKGTGIPIQPGSKIILQIHYNTLNGVQEDPGSSMEIEVADTVDKPAALVPFTNPYWVEGLGMTIPAGESNVSHTFSYDPSAYLGQISNGVISPNEPYTMYSAAVHMHLRGQEETLSVTHPNGNTDCLLDVPNYQFRWQGAYFFNDPMTLNPGDKLNITCTWDNSAANQPYFNGVQIAPSTLNWGEGTTDEMCLGLFYVTN
jgi:hypothetical protein